MLKNFYFGWNGGKKSVLERMPNGDLQEHIVRRNDNKDHNGVVGVSYKIIDAGDNRYTLIYTLNFCSPKDGFSRIIANEDFLEKWSNEEYGRLTYEKGPIDGYEKAGLLNEFVQKEIWERVIKVLALHKNPQLGWVVKPPYWLRTFLRNYKLGNRNSVVLPL